jgi:hypothetical protein
LVREEICAFANGHVDGYLVLGVDPASTEDQGRRRRREPCAWQVKGWLPPGGEPDTWISGSVREGLDPRPHIDARSFALEGGRWLSVVRVPPLPLTPCITNDGLIFERLPGITQKVTSSSGLRALFEAGREARTAAENRSQTAMQGLWTDWPLTLDSTHYRNLASPLAVLGLASPSLPADMSPILFRKSTQSRLRDVIGGQLQRIWSTLSMVPEAEIKYSGLTWFGQVQLTLGITVVVARVRPSGEIAVGYAVSGNEDAFELLSGGIRALPLLWNSAHAIARYLGAYGACHAWIGSPEGRDSSVADFKAWSDVDGDPTDEEVAAIQRQIRRRKMWVGWEEPEA